MHSFAALDQTRHGTAIFPAEYYYVDSHHSRYQMPFHWHREWEILRVLSGTFHIHLEGKEHCANAGDILLIRGGTLHGGTPVDCEYECFVFDFYGLFRTMELVKGSSTDKPACPKAISRQAIPRCTALSDALWLQCATQAPRSWTQSAAFAVCFPTF